MVGKLNKFFEMAKSMVSGRIKAWYGKCVGEGGAWMFRFRLLQILKYVLP